MMIVFSFTHYIYFFRVSSRITDTVQFSWYWTIVYMGDWVWPRASYILEDMIAVMFSSWMTMGTSQRSSAVLEDPEARGTPSLLVRTSNWSFNTRTLSRRMDLEIDIICSWQQEDFHCMMTSRQKINKGALNPVTVTSLLAQSSQRVINHTPVKNCIQPVPCTCTCTCTYDQFYAHACTYDQFLHAQNIWLQPPGLRAGCERQEQDWGGARHQNCDSLYNCLHLAFSFNLGGKILAHLGSILGSSPPPG